MPPTANPVLVVDDQEDARTVTSVLLSRSGFSVASARNGKDALSQIQSGLRPGIILLDVMMPEMDGPTFAEHLRALPDRELANTPIVLFTGTFDTTAAERRSAAVAVLRKPVGLHDILTTISRHAKHLTSAP